MFGGTFCLVQNKVYSLPLTSANMDPGSVVVSALGAAAACVATTVVDEAHKHNGIKGILTLGAIIVGIFALFKQCKLSVSLHSSLPLLQNLHLLCNRLWLVSLSGNIASVKQAMDL